MHSGGADPVTLQSEWQTPHNRRKSFQGSCLYVCARNCLCVYLTVLVVLARQLAVRYDPVQEQNLHSTNMASNGACLTSQTVNLSDNVNAWGHSLLLTNTCMTRKGSHQETSIADSETLQLQADFSCMQV